MPKDDNSLPALSESKAPTLEVELKEFIPVEETDSDTQTTKSDLAQLNNHLAMCNASLPYVRSIDSLCRLSDTVCKLIEVRRKVKKLDYGSNNKGSSGRAFEVID